MSLSSGPNVITGLNGISGIMNAGPSNPIDERALIQKLNELAATKFKDVFYTMFDTQRREVIQMFGENCSVVWEGHATKGLVGVESLSDLLSNLPPSKHTVESFDVHAIGGSPSSLKSSLAVNSLLVSITGSVAWGLEGSQMLGFHHVFILDRCYREKPQHFIISASFRSSLLADQKVGGGQKRPNGGYSRSHDNHNNNHSNNNHYRNSNSNSSPGNSNLNIPLR